MGTVELVLKNYRRDRFPTGSTQTVCNWWSIESRSGFTEHMKNRFSYLAIFGA